MRLVIRSGEQVVGTMEDEKGGQVPITVVEYLMASLVQDELDLADPLNKKLLQEALEHVHDEGFTAERYFINYPDPAISGLAFDLASDSESLSRMHQKPSSTTQGQSEYDLATLVEHILTDYKMEIVERQLSQALRETQDPQLIRDPQRFTEVMTRYKELKEIERRLAQQQGGRVMK